MILSAHKLFIVSKTAMPFLIFYLYTICIYTCNVHKRDSNFSLLQCPSKCDSNNPINIVRVKIDSQLLLVMWWDFQLSEKDQPWTWTSASQRRETGERRCCPVPRQGICQFQSTPPEPHCPCYQEESGRRCMLLPHDCLYMWYIIVNVIAIIIAVCSYNLYIGY